MNIFTLIKSRTSIIDVVGEYTTLKKAGAYYKGRCPFHHEKTASFTVSPHKDIFYCFGCHQGGDAIAFISRAENCSALESAQFLAQRFNIEIPKDIDAHHQSSSAERVRYYDVCNAITRWCHAQLLKSPSALTFLRDRGFTDATLKQFQIGLFPGGMQNVSLFVQQMKRESILVEDLLQAHFLSHGKTVLYSPFEERIIFPITDQIGRHCGFGGRIFKPQDNRAKYYNSHEHELFSKGSLLFGLDHAKKAIQEKDHVFLVEGYTDCLAMAQHGYQNSVATLGTACTPHHLKILSRYAHYLYVLFDNDAAGNQAMMRLTKMCWQANIEPLVIKLPTGHDPASFLANNGNLTAYIQQAQDIFHFFIDATCANYTGKSLHERMALAREIVETIKQIEDPLKQDILLQKAAETVAIPFESLKQELIRSTSSSKNELAAKSSQQPPPLPVSNSTPQPLSELEKAFFCAIIHNTHFFNERGVTAVINYLPVPYNQLLKALYRAWQADEKEGFDLFFQALSEQEQRIVSKMLVEYGAAIDSSAFVLIVSHLLKKQWKLIAQAIRRRIELAKQAGDHERVQELIHTFTEYKKQAASTGHLLRNPLTQGSVKQ